MPIIMLCVQIAKINGKQTVAKTLDRNILINT